MSIEKHGEGWQVEVHETIEHLEPVWRSLEAKGCCTLFQSYDWLRVWYEVTSRHGLAEPVIVTAARPGSEGPEVIFPLCRTRQFGWRKIEFADILVSDFAGPVFAPDAFAGQRSIRALWAAVRKALPRCDVIHLNKICTSVGGRPNPLLDLSGLVECPESLWGVPLAGAEPGELPPALDAKFAKKIVKRERRLAREHRPAFEWIDDDERLPAVFETLRKMRLERFEALGRAELLHEPAWLDFYRTLVARRHEGFGVKLARITADDETIAVCLGVQCNGALHYIMPSFLAGSWNRHAPGFQLAFAMMRECTRRGIGYFDLTIGDERYKSDIGAQRRPIYQAFVPVTVRGLIPYATWRLRYEIGRRPHVAALARWLLMRPRTA